MEESGKDGLVAAGENGHASEEQERALRTSLAHLRLAPHDFRVRVEAGELLIGLGERERGLRVLRSAADYFTMAGFPLRALWALKLLAEYGAERAEIERGMNLLAKHYAANNKNEHGDVILELPMVFEDAPPLDDLPAALSGVIEEIERRATDIVRGAIFPSKRPKFPLLSDLRRRPFLTVCKAIRLRRVDEGDLLIREGTAGQSVHLLVLGEARVVKGHGQHNQKTLARIYEGAVFGEMTLITGSPRVASVVAAGPGEVLEIPRTVLDDLGADATTLQSVLLRQVSERMLGNLVKLSPVFRVLSKKSRKALMPRFKSRIFDVDEEIITQGETSRGLFVILDGMVNVSRPHEGDELTLNVLREGDFFGEISLLTDLAATATCSAVRRTMVLLLPREAFADVVRHHPELAEKINEVGEFRLLDSIYSLA
jgi:CRP-like cAMP-binding protein